MRTAANVFYIAHQVLDPTDPRAGKFIVTNASDNKDVDGTFDDAPTASAKAEELNGDAFMARAAAANAMARRA